MSTTDLGSLSPAEKRALLAERLRGRRKERRFPASFAQSRMWFLEQLTPGNAAYSIPGAMRVHGRLDLDVWRRCARELVRRHEALRTTFEAADGAPVQVIAPDGEPEITVANCPQLRGDGPEQHAEIVALAREEFARPFDLATGPLLRFRFLRLADDEHILLMTLHHIAGDLWSTSVAFGELIALYGAWTTGAEPDLAPLPIQYADYTLWQRKRLTGEATAADLAYWRETLRGAPPMLELPTDRPRPAVQSTRGGSVPFRLPAAAASALREASGRAGGTPFMGMLAAFDVLLHRYSREEDLVVGVPVANRTRPEVEGLIGLFVNMVALRADVSGNPTFLELIGRVRESALGAFAHQELPFERLVEELHPQRDLSRPPVFQVSFIYQNITLPDFGSVGLRMEPVEVPGAAARFDLTLEVFEGPDGLSGSLEYNSDLFDEATVRRMAGHLTELTTALAAAPEAPIGDAAMLTPAEEAALRAAGNDTARDRSADLPVPDRIAARAAHAPDAEAVRTADGAHTLTYGELDRRANQLARVLRAKGVGRDVLVGLCVERTPRMLIAMLAVLKAGGAYVPLDPGFPADRIAFTLQDSGLALLLTERAVLTALTAETALPVAETLCLDEADGLLDAESTQPPATGPIGGDDLAYVIYTSGSTGRPKGVQIPHSALGNFLAAMGERPGLAEGDLLCAVTTLAFDISMLELLLPLTAGARVLLADRGTAADGARLAAALTASGATVMQATPSTWRMLLDAGWHPADGFRILAGGEALPQELADRLVATGAEVWNMYGPTETTIWSSVARVGDGPVTLGTPIANTQLHVLDAHGRLAAPGVPGELCIGGAGLARGYLGRPELTAERFVPHPFPTAPDERLYRTGDLVRRTQGGAIEFLGRLDHQVKLRGYRIELGEIETVLEAQDSVEQAVVTVREDTAGDQRLTAYVVLAPDTDGEGTDAAARLASLVPRLRTALGVPLPDYMIPTAYVALDALPLTPNGKIDRKALPAPDTRRSGDDYTAPRTPVEEVIAGIWAEALGLDRVGVTDDFFALGGHSLLSTRIVARLRDTFQADVPLHRVFREPTVAGLAEVLLQEGGDRAVIEKTAALLIRLAELSDDQVEAALGDPGSPA
ncbi:MULTISPECIES: amino acid adenylation domain-containing protein [Streptomyces]|uniref:Amino acid adenylation domain-containing protein n=1 Tax=Streptomyces ramulosus TaxID=47762 RepID=A0ABW1FA84_9ACTN